MGLSSFVQIGMASLGLGLVMPPVLHSSDPRLPPSPEMKALLLERDELRKTVLNIEEFRGGMVERYTQLGDRMERLLSEHGRSIDTDKSQLDDLTRTASDIGARLELRLEELQKRKVAQDKQESALNKRFDTLTGEFKDAKKEHDHYVHRNKEEEEKIRRFTESAEELRKEREAAQRDHDAAYQDYSADW